jgi:hypothetical protein
MKTGITITDTIQIGMDEFKDIKKTKVFDDNTTLLEIKEWIKSESPFTKVPINEISLSSVTVSDVF